MTPARLLLELAARNILVRAEGDALRFAPADGPNAEERAALKACKGELLALLQHADPDRGEWRFAFRNFADEAQPGYVAYAVVWSACFPRVPTGARWLSIDQGRTWWPLDARPTGTVERVGVAAHAGEDSR
jgi:hypothetical protein